MTAPQDVALVLLAAGTSRRFGAADKLLANLDGEPLIRHALRGFAPFDFGERIAVIRPGAQVLEALLKGAGFVTVENPAPALGMGRSLALGVAAIGRAQACLIALADMPYVPAAHIAAVLDTSGDCVASARNGVRQPPVLFRKPRFTQLRGLSGPAGARSLLNRCEAIEAGPLALGDIDTPNDLRSQGGPGH